MEEIGELHRPPPDHAQHATGHGDVRSCAALDPPADPRHLLRGRQHRHRGTPSKRPTANDEAGD